ncbi:MAG: DUF167 domain-containing protein [Verrucomicrobiota bacterium]
MPYLHSQSGNLVLSVKLQPRASSSGIGEPLGNELRIRVTAPPVDAAANRALMELLSEVLGCGRAQLELVRGQTSRHKMIRIHGISEPEARRRLQSAGEKGSVL